jgi:tetratricopeptide (TPR) repeat protein
VSQSSNRWVVKVVLVLAVVAFVGVSIFGILNLTQSPNQSRASNGGSLSASDQQSKLEDEVRGYDLVLQREPDNQVALKGVLEARLQLLSQKRRDQVQKADIQALIEPLTKLAKLNPDNSAYTVLLAQAKEQIGDKEGAAEAYQLILATKPGDLKALQGMVTLLLSQQRPEAAIGLLQDTLAKAGQANKIQPESVDTIAVQILLGSVYAFQKKYTEATTVYDQAIIKEPKDFRPVLAKALLLKKQGNDTQAKPLFDQALALAPDRYKDEINQAIAIPSPPPNP